MLYETQEQRIEEKYGHDLNDNQKLILEFLYTGEVGRKEIEENTDLTKRQIRYNLGILIDLGVVEKENNLLDMRTVKYRLSDGL